MLEKNKNIIANQNKIIADSVALTENVVNTNLEPVSNQKKIVKEKPIEDKSTAENPKNTPTNPVIKEVELLKAKNNEKLTKINIKNLNIETLHQKRENKFVPSTLAKEVDVLRINFIIPSNFVVRGSIRNYYVQILDNKNTIIGDELGKISFENNQKLTYSLNINPNYKNKELIVSEKFLQKNFKIGTYTVKVYDKSDLVSQTTFSLN